MKRLALALALACLPVLAFGQGTTVVTTPSPRGSVHADGTIAVTNTFQTVLSSRQGLPPGQRREGCLIQNNGVNTMYVYVGAAANGDKAKSFTLIPPGTGIQGGSFSCATGAGGVIQDEIAITGTSSDAFTATWQ